MSLVDVGIVLFVIALAAVGYERGLLASALPLAGFVGGAALGARVGPELLPGGRRVALRAAGRDDRRGADRRASPRSPSTGSRGACGGATTGGAARASTASAGPLLLAALGAARLLGIRRRRPARDRRSGRATCARRCSSRRSSARSTTLLPPSGPLLNVLRRVDPTPPVRGPDADVPPPDPAVDRRPRGAGGRRLDRAGARDRLRARGRGLGLGGGARTGGHQRARGRRRGRHHGQPPGRNRVRGHRRPLRHPQRPRPARRRGARRAAAGPLAETAAKGDDAAVHRLPAERAADRHPGAPRTHREGDQRGLLRPRAGASGG